MQENAKNSYWRDRLVLISLSVGFLVNIILWLSFFGKFGFGGGETIPLHFNIVYGIDLVGPAKKIFLIPLVGLAVLVVNAILGQLIYRDERMYSYFFCFGATVVQFLLSVSALSFFILLS